MRTTNQIQEDIDKLKIELEESKGPIWDTMTTSQIQALLDDRNQNVFSDWSRCPVGTLCHHQEYCDDTMLWNLGMIMELVANKDWQSLIDRIRMMTRFRLQQKACFRKI